MPSKTTDSNLLDYLQNRNLEVRLCFLICVFANAVGKSGWPLGVFGNERFRFKEMVNRGNGQVGMEENEWHSLFCKDDGESVRYFNKFFSESVSQLCSQSVLGSGLDTLNSLMKIAENCRNQVSKKHYYELHLESEINGAESVVHWQLENFFRDLFDFLNRTVAGTGSTGPGTTLGSVVLTDDTYHLVNKKARVNHIRSKSSQDSNIPTLKETFVQNQGQQFEYSRSDHKPESHNQSSLVMESTEKPDIQWQKRDPDAPVCPQAILKHLNVDVERIAKDRITFSDTVRNWKVLCASVRGRSHEHRGKYREDSFRVTNGEDYLIVTLCDGAGASKFSRVASEFVSGAINKAIADKMDLANLPGSGGTALAETLASFLGSATKTVSKELEDAIREIDPECDDCLETPPSLRDFWCTQITLLFYYGQDGGFLVTGRVGDGFVSRVDNVGNIKTLVGGHSGEMGGEVNCFVPDPNAYVYCHNSISVFPLDNTSMVIAGTDGIEDPFIPIGTNITDIINQLKNGVVEPLDYLNAQIPQDSILYGEDPERSIKTWLNFRRRGDNDDRTIVVLESLNG